MLFLFLYVYFSHAISVIHVYTRIQVFTVGENMCEALHCLTTNLE